MNCVCDEMAKGVVWGLAGGKVPKQGVLLLKAVAMYVGEDKLSSGMSKHVRFWVLTVCLGRTKLFFFYFHLLCLIWHVIERYG